MKRWLALLAIFAALIPMQAGAHLGSPDVFFDGTAGPYPVSVTIRVPGVVPGRAQIIVRVRSDAPVGVAVAPISAKTAISNTPPAEVAQPVAGQTNVFSGELWLMAHGAYGIDVRVQGPSGAGSVQIPVNSIATHMLPLPPWLGKALLAMALVLFAGGIAIIAAASSESIVPPGVAPGAAQRRRFWRATAITTVVFTLMLFGGKRWWNAEEKNYRESLREGGWPDLTAEVHAEGAQRIMTLYLGKSDWDEGDFTLEPDHGKLLHLYLVRQPGHDVFAHLHPVRGGDIHTYIVPLPPIPEGDYEVLCDLTRASSGVSSTATNVVHIPPPAVATHAHLKSDPDDSWAIDSSPATKDNATGDMIFHLDGGKEVVWKAHPALWAQQDACLRFEVRDAVGKQIALEPYMGMSSHAAILRADGKVFSHLHPSGNYSMAAQLFFDAKLGKEHTVKTGGHGNGVDPICGPDGNIIATSTPVITLPYEFPSPGDYRVWVQVKSEGRVQTAVFDADVQPASM